MFKKNMVFSRVEEGLLCLFKKSFKITEICQGLGFQELRESSTNFKNFSDIPVIMNMLIRGGIAAEMTVCLKLYCQQFWKLGDKGIF